MATMFRTAFKSSLRASPSLRQPTLSHASPILSTLARTRLLSTEARSQIQKAIDDSPLVLFMKGNPDAPQCGFSRAVVQVLDIHGVPPEKMKTYDVLADSELRSGIKEFSEWPTVPQLYVRSEFVGGCDIVLSMHQSGELEDLLIKKDIIDAHLPEDAPGSEPAAAEKSS
ncbi:glutaredoxin [Stereum hirsutum FP-91666 SS1]|uniref:glutaredoxin n=1 Tax=Stereum hirsutum (strain FP-91666) TaxID=721885 RepID=UPI000440E0F2|nr:glutaredoxin [Stereum hirsutum FP-91666 SS1]EIM86555.1 glutaredoxin [Stereum hirsutum FP-91666 SS1]